MAPAGNSKNTKIQVQHVFIAVIIIVSTLSVIASIVLITIGYLNPFGTVGLGILGGGCVLYFATLLFLCSASIWVKNKYYADENDCTKKWTPSSIEDISLLGPASKVNSPTENEPGTINENERQLDNNCVPLYSASTVYSSVFSSTSTVPDQTMLCNWQGGDAEGALDCDVFSSSLTAMQHTDMKLQEKLNLKRGSTEPNYCESTSEWKTRDLEMRKIPDLPILYSNEKSVSNTPCQRKPVVMDFVETKYTSAGINTNPQICGRNNIPAIFSPAKVPPNSAAQSKHQHVLEQVKHRYESKATNKQPTKDSQEWKPALEKREIYAGEKDNQTPGRHWSIISATDSWTHNPRVQTTKSKGLNTVPAGTSETEKMQITCNKLNMISQERTKKPLQKLLPNTLLNQSEKLQLSSQITTSENQSTKGKVMTKPGPRKGF